LSNSENADAAAPQPRSKKLGTLLGFAALTLAVGTVALWSRQIDAVAIPENRTLFVALFLCAAGLGIAAFIMGTRWFGGLAAFVGIFLGAFLPLTMAISRQEVTLEAIQVGDTIPHFTAVNEHGQPFDSNLLQGQLLLIKFFRAHW
jgi:hypothetical protein